jgi:hypothetical protein
VADGEDLEERGRERHYDLLSGGIRSEGRESPDASNAYKQDQV